MLYNYNREYLLRITRFRKCENTIVVFVAVGSTFETRAVALPSHTSALFSVYSMVKKTSQSSSRSNDYGSRSSMSFADIFTYPIFVLVRSHTKGRVKVTQQSLPLYYTLHCVTSLAQDCSEGPSFLHQANPALYITNPVRFPFHSEDIRLRIG